jgi:3-oxoacyl-[acyl-carrier-protein] synthase II
MGVVSPLGNSVAAFWEGATAGRSGIRRIDRFDTTELHSKMAGMAEDAIPAGFGPKDVRRQSRCILFAIEAADQAWKHAGLNIDQENPWRCGAYIGSGIGGIDSIYENAVKMSAEGARRVSPFMLPQGLTNMPVGMAGIRLGLKGPNVSLVSACASGAHSIGMAADAIRLGKADVMLAGGTEATVIPFAMAAFCSLHALSTRNDDPGRASRPFDAGRDGFVMGEGAGVLVLESEAHARARGAEILGEIAGFGETCDAHHVTAPSPDGSGCAEAMRAALRQAQMNPSEIGYYNAHGTSTKLNDSAESLSLRAVFGEAMPPVSSTKSMIGHLLGAAGAVEAIITLMTIREGVITPNINYEDPDPECSVNLVANTAREADVAAALSTSLGFGGQNAAIVIRRYV